VGEKKKKKKKKRSHPPPVFSVEKRKIKHHSQMRRTLQLKRIEYRKKDKTVDKFQRYKTILRQ